MPDKYVKAASRSLLWRTFRRQWTPTPRTQVSLMISATNWTFGLWAGRFGPHLFTSIGLDLGPLEVHVMYQSRKKTP